MTPLNGGSIPRLVPQLHRWETNGHPLRGCSAFLKGRELQCGQNRSDLQATTRK